MVHRHITKFTVISRSWARCCLKQRVIKKYFHAIFHWFSQCLVFSQKRRFSVARVYLWTFVGPPICLLRSNAHREKKARLIFCHLRRDFFDSESSASFPSQCIIYVNGLNCSKFTLTPDYDKIYLFHFQAFPFWRDWWRHATRTGETQTTIQIF